MRYAKLQRSIKMNIQVNAATSQYAVTIGPNSLRSSVEAYKALFEKADKIVLLTDEHVWRIHEQYVRASIPYPFEVFVMPAGEACKTFEVFGEAHSFMLEQPCTRKSLVLALGGGAVGDLAGFVAATYMRGVPFIQIPTTILAHDSAVGGKTAINHPNGKNMVGAFYQPAAVLYDTTFLQTLPEKEVRSGMTEVIKHAMLSDEAWLEEMLALTITSIEEEVLTTYLAKGVQVKATIVEQDETEQSVRKYLNLGHTYGHALEAAAGYGKLTHGESVMTGILYMLLLSEKYGEISHDYTKRFARFVKENGYPIEALQSYSFETLKSYLVKDKKADYGELHFVLLRTIAQPFMQIVDLQTCEETDQQLRTLIKEVLA